MASRRARRRAGQSRGAGRTGVWFGRVVLGLVVLGAIAALGGYLWLKNYLRSDGFRQMVNLKVSEVLEAEATFDQFKWDGMEMRAPNFSAEGSDLIRRIELEDLKSEIQLGALLRKRVETEEVQVGRLHVELDVTRDGPRFEAGPRQVVQFDNVSIDELSGEVDFGETSLHWNKVRGSLKPGQGRGSYAVSLARGQLLTPLSLFPELDLQKATLRFVDDELVLQNGAFKVFDSGRLRTDGELDFENGNYFFEGHLTDVLCEEVVPEDWSKRITGQLTSHFTVEGEGKKAPVIMGNLKLTDGYLTALPVLDRIAAYTATERFRRVSLRRAELNFRQEGKLLELTDLVVVSDGLLRIEGRLAIDDERLNGDLLLGLAPRTLANIPGAAHRVFHPGKEDLLWTPVKISGTTKYPREDLSDRLIVAGFEWMYEKVGGELVLKQSGNVAGDVANALWDTGGSVARLGAEIIGQGTGILGGVPNPVGPIRNGVGSVIEGILGTPRKSGEGQEDPKRALPELLPLPGDEKEDGRKSEGKGPDAGDPRIPLIPNLGGIPGKALDLIERELGIEEAEEKKRGDSDEEDPGRSKDSARGTDKQTARPERAGEEEEPRPRRTPRSFLERELGIDE